MAASNIHLTLVFLGDVEAGRIPDLCALAQSVVAPGFELAIDNVSYWRHNRIGWLGASETPPQHFELVRALNGALQRAGFPVDARPHVPHVTLLRNSRGGEVPACTPVIWPIDDFVLVKSNLDTDGAHYEVIRRWPLG